MNLIGLSEADLESVDDLFSEFHEGYTPFFKTTPKA